MARPKMAKSELTKNSLPYGKAADLIKGSIPIQTDKTVTNLFAAGSTNTFQESRSSSGRLHGSSVFCERHESLASNFEWEKQQTPAGEIYKAIGVAVEKAVQNGLLMAGALMASNIKIEPQKDLNLGGEIDAVILADSKLWVLEIKTIGSLPAQPLLKHKYQAMAYSVVTGLPARLLYVSRKVASYGFNQEPELETAEFILPFNYQALKQVAYKIFLGHLYSDALQLAPIPQDFRKTVQCKYCPFVRNCWDNEPLPLSETTESMVAITESAAKDAAVNFMNDINERQMNFIEYMLQDDSSTAIAWDTLTQGRYKNLVTDIYLQ